MAPRPPWLGRLLLRLRRLGTRREEIETDLLELFRQRAAERGRWYAALRYSADAASLWIHWPERLGRPSGQPGRRMSRVDAIALDLRYAARMLRKRPFLTFTVVVTLAIGIGAPTSAFSLINGLLFRTPVTGDPDAFFRVVRADREARGIVTPPQYLVLRDENESARELAAWSTMSLSAPLDAEDPTRVPGLLVSCNLFRVLGVEAAVLGRLLGPEDCAAALPVAVISEPLWRNRFGADPSVIGTSLSYGAVPIAIVGVASVAPFQRRAHDPDGDFVADLWFPYTAHAALKTTSTFEGLLLRDTFPWLELAGLLKPGISRQTAAVELRLIESRRDDLFEPSPESAVILTDGSRWGGMQWDDVVDVFGMMQVLPVLIMLVASLNVAALLLSRAINRQREMAVRLALGTSRRALIRMLLTESILVSGLAVLASLFLVYRLPPMLVRFFEAELTFGTPDSLAPDGRVYAFLALSGVAAALLSGLAPALESLNPHLAEALQGSRGFVFRRGPSRTRRVFVGVQVAASMVLLVAAATFSHTAGRFTGPGFTTGGLLVAQLRESQGADLPLSTIAGDAATIPGVASVAYANDLPLLREGTMRVRLPGRSQVWSPLTASVSPDYFDVFDIPILAGRSFERLDAGQGAGLKPVVVSRQFARRLFANDNILGEIIEPEDPSRGARMVIIGISGDRITGRSRSYPAMNDGSMIYELMEPTSLSGFLVVKTADNAVAMAEVLQSLLRELTGSATSVQTFESSLAGEVVGVRRAQTLLLAMGAVSLLLAIIGVVATVSADAKRRTREFAIRRALGASPWAVRRGVVLSGLRPVHIGLFFGLLASWGAMTTIESMHVLPLGSVAGEPAPYIAISLLLLFAALGALLAVAHRVVRRDPFTSLREE